MNENRFLLSDRTFRLLTDLIYANSGIRFEETGKFILQRRLSQRLRILQLDSFEKYYLYLVYHPGREAELEAIFDLITTHETYFFREQRQLTAFTEEIIPEMIRERMVYGGLRIWSAGCATGEEPYTIAILCREMQALRNWKIEIYASDISQKVIQSARKGIYTAASFRSTPDNIKNKYFEITEDNKYRLKDEVRQMVTFGKLNLLDEKRTAILGEFDAIFCRNVLMYFDLEAKKKVIENFYNKLRKNGFLMLGHAESLLTLSTRFKLRHFTNDMVYQK